MFEYTCPVCGKVTQVHKEWQKRTYCSTTCAAKAREEKLKEVRVNFLEGDCVFQPESIMCYERNCANCGWNPVVANSRLEAIRKKLDTGIELYECHRFGWFSVSDKLPRDDVQVLCLTKTGRVITSHRKDGRWCTANNVIITDWMPLPQAPSR